MSRRSQSLPYLVALVVLSSALLGAETSPLTINRAVLAQAEQYAYYGYVPARIYYNESALFWYAGGFAGWMYTRHGAETVTDRAVLAITGNQDETRVRVYALPERLVDEFTLRKMENRIIYLANGSFFKVLSDRPVTVILAGGKDLEAGNAIVSTFITCTDGGYVGREFIFMAVQSKTVAYAAGLPYAVYALEDSEVTVSDENGTTTTSFRLSANRVYELSFTPFKVYRVLSTGNVMVQTFAISRSVFYPAVQGGFVGRLFYGKSASSELWETGDSPINRSFVITGLVSSKVEVIDLENRKAYVETNVTAGGSRSLAIKVPHMVIQTEQPVTLGLQSSKWEGGLSYMGLKGGETACLDVPTGEAYIFAYKETVVNLDDVTVRLPPDGVLPLPEGPHRVAADQNILVEILNVAKDQGIVTFATCLPSAQSLSISHAELRLKAVISEETPWLYVAGAAVPAIAILAWWLMRRRSKP